MIYYSLNGEYYTRTKPNQVNRSTASVKSGLNFGRASRLSRQIRLLIAPLNPCNADKKLMFRLTGTLNRFIHCISSANPTEADRSAGLACLRDFQFNDQAIVAGLLNFSVRANSKDSGPPGLTISPFIPGSSLPAPKKQHKYCAGSWSPAATWSRPAQNFLEKRNSSSPTKRNCMRRPHCCLQVPPNRMISCL